MSSALVCLPQELAHPQPDQENCPHDPRFAPVWVRSPAGRGYFVTLVMFRPRFDDRATYRASSVMTIRDHRHRSDLRGPPLYRMSTG